MDKITTYKRQKYGKKRQKHDKKLKNFGMKMSKYNRHIFDPGRKEPYIETTDPLNNRPLKLVL